MKTYTLLLPLIVAGCMKTETLPTREVTVIQVPPPRVYGQVVEVIEVMEESNEVPHTWMTGEEVKRAKQERLIKEHPECDCQPGDPLCSCIE